MFTEVKASEFLAADDPIQMLSKTNSIILDEERFEKSPLTTDELRECIRDIRVCGGGELRKVIFWIYQRIVAPSALSGLRGIVSVQKYLY
jgi:hypothetical protein